MTKRIFVLLLALCMIIALYPHALRCRTRVTIKPAR